MTPQTAMPPTEASPAAERRTSGVRGRALVIGSLGVAATAYLVTQAEMVLSSVRIGYLQFPPVALGLLLVTVAAGRLARRVSARWGLSSSDLLVIYGMMLVGAMVSSHGVAQKLVPLLVMPRQFADASNDWHGLYDPHTPQSLVPWDVHNPAKSPVVAWYYGKMPRGESLPWQPWIVPLLLWGVLIVLILFAFLCLTAILRRQWVDNEKLAFPLTQLPLEIAGDEDRPQFFRNGLMWFGALIPVVVFGVKALHQVQPSVPDVPLQWVLSDYLTGRPWDHLPYTCVVISFAALGFFFLLPTDILFSVWFFFLLSRVMQIVATLYNMDMPEMPQYGFPLFIGYQVVGAYLVLLAYFFWIARPHLRRVWATALGRPGGYSPAEDADELLPYRVAVWGLFGSLALAAVWLWVAGMSPWLAVFELVFGVCGMGLIMVRSTAEAGMLMTETTFAPSALIRLVAPLHAFGGADLTILSYFDAMWTHDRRGILLAGLLDGARLADGTRVRRRAFAGVFALGMGLALVLAVGLNVYFPYHIGAGSMDWWLESGSSRFIFQNNAAGFHADVAGAGSAGWQGPIALCVGLGVTSALIAMRAAFFWWPLHPLGYALMGTWTTTLFWFPCLVAWAIKALTIRYGGSGGYNRARPFFLGLILGEFGMAVLVVLLNIAFHLPPPVFPWE